MNNAAPWMVPAMVLGLFAAKDGNHDAWPKAKPQIEPFHDTQFVRVYIPINRSPDNQGEGA